MEDDTLTLQKMYFYLHPQPDKIHASLKKRHRELKKDRDIEGLKHFNIAIKALN